MAEKVRTRLEVVPEPQEFVADADILDELYYRKPIREHIKNFATVFAIVFVVYGAYDLYRGGVVSTLLALLFTSLILSFVSRVRPRWIYPVWKSWMAVGEGIGSVVTLVILTACWTIFLMMGLALRILRIKVMDTGFRVDVPSYWKEKSESETDFKLLERQY